MKNATTNRDNADSTTLPFIGSRGLIVEDSAYGVGLARVLQRRGAAAVAVCATVDAARWLVLAGSPHWALIDTRLADAETGLALAAWLRRMHPAVARISHAAFAPALLDLTDDTATRAPLFHAVLCKPCSVSAIIAALNAHGLCAERER